MKSCGPTINAGRVENSEKFTFQSESENVIDWIKALSFYWHILLIVPVDLIL